MTMNTLFRHLTYAILTLSTTSGVIYAWTGLQASPNDTLDASKWNQLAQLAQEAHDWGNHQVVGYLTGESDPSVESFAKTSLPACAAGQVLKGDGTSLSCVDDAAGAQVNADWNATSGAAQILNKPWSVGGANLYTANTGNVGIGTSAPDAKLHVNGLTCPVSSDHA